MGVGGKLLTQGSVGEKTKIAINIEIDQRKITQTMAEQAKPLAGQGRPSGEKKDYDCNVLSVTTQGNDQRYLTARIARDRPDILASEHAERTF